MAETVILTVAGTAATSDPFTLASGETASLVIQDPAGAVKAIVEQKGISTGYYWIGEWDRGSRILSGPGTFRVVRQAGTAFGVFRA